MPLHTLSKGAAGSERSSHISPGKYSANVFESTGGSPSDVTAVGPTFTMEPSFASKKSPEFDPFVLSAISPGSK